METEGTTYWDAILAAIGAAPGIISASKGNTNQNTGAPVAPAASPVASSVPTWAWIAGGVALVAVVAMVARK